MEYLQTLATVLRKDETDFLELKMVLSQFKDLVTHLADVDLESEAARENLHFDNGKAIGTTWAAACIDDLVRTKVFIKGLFKAIEAVKKQKTHHIHLLYAGCGPFATLILPIMAVYTPQEIQFTLIEINPISAESAKRLLHKLGFSEYIKKIEIADATKYQIDADAKFDIILSETMQRGLIKEQQVPIVANIMQQIKYDTLLIPEKINVVLALLNMSKYHQEGEQIKEESYIFRLGELLELSAANIMAVMATAERQGTKLLFPAQTFQVLKSQIQLFPQLVILTDIQVFGEEKIYFNQSGLTIPMNLKRFDVPMQDCSVKIAYKIDDVPGFEFAIS